MNLLEVVTPPPAIYHGCSNWKAFWEEKFTPVNMTSCGRRNVRNHGEIKNGEKYIILDIYYNIYCLESREVTSSEKRYYMGRPGKVMTTSLDLSTKSLNKIQKASFDINAITKQ